MLAFHSALGMPIVRRFEGREPDATREHRVRSNGFCEHAGALGPNASGSTQRERSQGTIGKALLTGAPAFSDSAASEPGSIGAAGLGELVAVPIVCDGPLVAVVAWHFQWIATRR